MHRRVSWLAVPALVLACSAHGHDTWFEARSQRVPGLVLVEIGTGNHFPTFEFGIDSSWLVRRGCMQNGAPLPLAAVAARAASLVLRVQAPGGGALSCWAELGPVEVELEPRIVEVYLADIAATAEVRAAWAALRARGLPWRERYVKNARIEIAGGDEPAAARAAAPAAPTGIDVLLTSGLGTIRSGDALTFRLLRDGQPLARQPVALEGTAGAPAAWTVTDADGRFAFTAPQPGRWVVRGTDLRLASDDATRWDSRFFNLAFDVR